MSEYARVSTARLAEIAELAEWIAGENTTPAGQTDVENLLRKKRITLSFSAYGDTFCGLLEHEGGRFHVYCNADRVGRRDSGRARFTLGHELGHYFIDDHRRCLVGGEGLHGSNIDYHPRNPVEQEADCFASNLLMPETAFRAAARRPAGLGTILGLQKRFATSVTGAAVRYCDLEIEPTAVIYWSPEGYAWKRLSQAFRESNCRKTIESFDRVDSGAATDQVRRGNDPSSTGFFESTTTISRWFPRTTPGSRSDVLLREGAIRLGAFGCLTVLSLRPGERLP